jgi:hypothetical protein
VRGSIPSVVSDVSALPMFVCVGKFSSLIGVSRASSAVSGEARGASVPFLIPVGLLDRMLYCLCVVRGRSVQNDFLVHLFWVRRVHVCVFIRVPVITNCMLLDILDFVVKRSV